MAKLSKRQSRHVSFLLHKMALSYGHDERQELLSKLLDALHIDHEQRAESADAAKRSANYDARRQRPVKPAVSDDIDSMSRDEVQTYIKQLYAKRDALLAQRAEQQPATTPEPAPVVTDAATYDVTAKQRRRLAAFDDMSDADQVDALKSLWGAA